MRVIYGKFKNMKIYSSQKCVPCWNSREGRMGVSRSLSLRTVSDLDKYDQNENIYEIDIMTASK